MNQFIKPTGVNFSCRDNLPADVMSSLLCKTGSLLQDLDPFAKLQRYDDWWEHDGLHFYREAIDFESLFKVLRSPQSLLEAMPGDDEVFVGIAPENSAWYLRFYLFWDDEGFNLLGRFDITVPQMVAHRYREEVIAKTHVEMEESESQVYYEALIL